MTLSTIQMVSAMIAGACVMFIILLYSMILIENQKTTTRIFQVCSGGFLIFSVVVLYYSI